MSACFPCCVEVEDSSDEEGSASHSGSRPMDAAAGYGRIKPLKIWDDRSNLKVCFLNPFLLEEWSYEGDKISTDTIMAWAEEWNKYQVPNVPRLEKADDSDGYKPDIRIQFTEKGGSTCKIGKKAENVKDKSEPTMCLNLKDLPLEQRKYLVIQAFGLSLGLEYEHQRSDFWSVIGKHITMPKMKGDKADLSKRSKSDNTYDHDKRSIMHHKFCFSWFKNRHHENVQFIEREDPELTSKEKKYLIWIHERQHKFAKSPSRVDLKALEDAYGQH